ncbi:hypothetical protein DRN74_05300, partial [Candidatus Micrarchaeota archaeon]
TEISVDNVKFWVIDTTEHLLSTPTLDVDNEYYYVNFNPDCNYQTGQLTWKVNVSNEACYANNASSDFIINVVGSLLIDLVKPDGTQNYTEDDNIELLANLTDDCGVAITDGDVYFNLTNLRTGESFRCPSTGFASYNGTFYNCTWDASNKPGGWYRVEAHGSKVGYSSVSDSLDNAFFLITRVKIINPQLTYPGDGSWGELHNFSLTVDHYEQINVCLLEKYSVTGDYEITECKYIADPSNAFVNFTRRYSCSEKEKLLYYKFNASQPGVNETYSESDEYSHYVQKDDITILYTFGNESSVNRAGNDKTKFILLIMDTDRNLPAVYNSTYESPKIRFKIYNGTSFVEDGFNVTNTTGHVEYNFDPSCVYDVGKQNWYGYTYLDSCYKDVSSSYFNVTIVGDLTPNVTYPNGQEFVRYNELYINVTGLVTDECSLHNIATADVNFTLISVAFNDVYYCEEIVNYNNGTYSCEFNLTTASQGWYNIVMNSSNVEFYNNGTTTKEYAFRIRQQWEPPVLENETVIPENDWGWGENFTFKVNVSDINGEDVNVSFWLSPDNQTWYYIDSQMCNDCGISTELTFYYKGFSCNDMPTYYFKFNASDAHNTTDKPGLNFTLTKDDVTFLYEGLSTGNKSFVNRSESRILRIRIYDSDNKTYLPANVQGKIWVTKDGISYDSGTPGTTDSEGYLSVTFTPDCNYNVGVQNWKAGTVGNVCYKDTNSSLGLILTIIGWLNNTIIEPNGDVYYSNQNVTIRANVSDECNQLINDAAVWFNITHDNFNDVCTLVKNEGNGYYNCSWNISNNPGGWYNITMNSERTYYNYDNETKIQAFFHEIAPVLAGEYVTPTESYWGTTFNFYVNVTDDDDTVTVQLWHRKLPSGSWNLADSATCTDCINTTIPLSHTYSQADIGTWEWFINASDAYNMTDITTTHTLNVTKRNVIVEYVAGNETNVSRVGANSTILTLIVKDAVSGSTIGAGLTGGFWITTDGTNEGPKIAATTDSGSYLNITFDPDCTYLTGKQKWKGGVDESSFYYAGNSTDYLVVNVWSESYPTILIPNGESYAKGDYVPLEAHIVDDCSNVTGATVRFRVIRGSNEFTPSPDPANDYNNGTYTSQWDSSTALTIGWYNVSVNVSKQYYFDSYASKENAFYLGESPELVNPEVTPGQEGWGYKFMFNVSFRDLEGDIVNVSLWKAYSATGPWYLVNSSNVSSTIWDEIKFYHRFTCNDYLSGPTIYYKFTAKDIHGFTNETQVKSLVLEQDDVNFLVVQGSGATVYREGEQNYTFIVMVNDSDKGEWVGSNVQGYFYFTYDGTTFDEGHFAQTNESGHISYDFNPNCSYSTGIQVWKLSITGNSCYKDTDSPSQTYSIMGQLKNNLQLPTYGSEFNVTDNILIRFNISTDCKNEGLINDSSPVTVTLIHVDTSTEYSCSNVNNEGNGYYNCTWDSTGMPEGNYSIKIYSERATYNSNTTTYESWFWLENIPTQYSNLIVNPPSGGWGETYEFNVTINDTEGDTVTCKLYVNTTGEWVYKGSDTISGTAGTPTVDNCSVKVNDFTCGEQGIASFKFEIIDGTDSNTFNTTVATGPTIGEDDVQITYVIGNNTDVNRAGNEGKKLILKVYDTDKGVYPVNANGSIWVNDGTLYFEWSNSTDQSGNLVIQFNPNCSYHVGTWKWFGGVKDDICYVDTNITENFTVNIIGNLTNVIVTPNGEEYLRGTNITIRVNVSDECGQLVSGATVKLSSISQQTSQNFSCIPVNDEGAGYYNCTFNTTGMPTQWYNIEMNSSKVYYNNKSVVKSNAFWIETAPILFAPQLIPEVGGWGETFTFKVNVTDEDYDLVTVYCWKRMVYPSIGDWQSCGSTTKQGINQQASFSTTFASTDRGNWTIKFNVTEDDVWNDTVEKNLTVEKDDVSIVYVTGDNTTVNRVSGSVTFKLRAVDTDKPTSLIAFQPAAFWITTNESEPESWGPTISTTTDDYGNFTINFDPDCTYGVGQQKWKGGLLENDYWKSANSTEFRVNITSEYKPYITRPINEIFLRGVDDIPLRGNLTDLAGCGGVESATVQFVVENNNYICSAIEEGNGWYNCTISATTTGAWAYGWYNVLMNATRDYYAYAESQQNNSFYLADDPDLSNAVVDSSTGIWGKQFVFNVTLTDLDPDNVTVYFWIKGPGGDWRQIDNYTYVGATPGGGVNIGFVWNSTCDDVGSNEFKFNATDTSGYSDELYGGSFTVNEHVVSIFIISGSGEQIDREGNDSKILISRVRDESIPNPDYVSSGVNGSFWIKTKTGWFEYDTETNQSGYLTYVFDPNCSYDVGEIEWKVGVFNDKCYVDTNATSSLNITGQLKNNLQLPTYSSTFNVTQQILIRFNTTSDCSDEGLIPNATVTIELISPYGVVEQCTPLNNEYDGWYNCTWDSTAKKEGWWSIRLNSTKMPYYHFNFTLYENWFWLENWNTTAENATVWIYNYTTNKWEGLAVDQQVGWTRLFNYTVDIYDREGDTINCSLYIKRNSTNVWELVGTDTIQGTSGIPTQGTCQVLYQSFTCNDIGTNYFKWEIKNGEKANYYNTTESKIKL